MFSIFYSRTVQAISAWLAVTTAVFAMLSRFTPEWFGTLTWPQSTLVGIALALALGFLVALLLVVAGVGYRLIRPLFAKAVTPFSDTSLGPRFDTLVAVVEALTHEKADLEEAVTALREKVGVVDRKTRERLEPLETNYKAILHDYQGMRGLEARLEDRFTIIERRLDDGREGSAANFDMLFLALQALLARERIGRLTEVILREGEFLTSRVNSREPVKGEHWEAWQSHKATFDSAMERWMETAQGWHSKIAKWVQAVKPAQLTDGRWVGLDELFHGSNAVITYQTFAIQFENWKRHESQIRTALHIAAFGGPSAQAKLKGLPGGGPSVQTVTESLDD